MKPILFNTRMVRAILDGRKTVTRRVIEQDIVDRFILDDSGKLLGSFTEEAGDGYPTVDDCNYLYGDILWVRETWCPCEKYFGKSEKGVFYYRADSTAGSEECRKQYGIPWHPSIFMPREAARLFLRITNVRAERLQEITEVDAKAEGIVSYWAEPHRDDAPFIGAAKEIGADLCSTRREAFQQLWESLKPKPEYTWKANPWVWVIEFEKITKQEAENA